MRISAMKKKRKQPNDRRKFLKKSVEAMIVTPALLGSAAWVSTAAPVQAQVDRLQILAALGDTLIPSGSGKPGFKSFQPDGITEEVNKNLIALQDELFVTFNQASSRFFEGRTFVELSEDDRARFLRKVISGEEFRDRALHQRVHRLYRLVRMSVFRVFYSNFPEGKIPRDAHGIPIPKPGELHQITTPNTPERVTGWDIAGYRGPLTWEQEEKQRAEVQKIHWHDHLEDLVVRYRPKSPKK
jgi:hypothetical protein